MKDIIGKCKYQIKALTGFRFTSWEIRQMLLAEYHEINVELTNSMLESCSRRDSLTIEEWENLHELNDFFGYINYLHYKHFLRGLDLLITRDPAKGRVIYIAMQVLNKFAANKNSRSTSNYKVFKSYYLKLLHQVFKRIVLIENMTYESNRGNTELTELVL